MLRISALRALGGGNLPPYPPPIFVLLFYGAFKKARKQVGLRPPLFVASLLMSSLSEAELLLYCILSKLRLLARLRLASIRSLRSLIFRPSGCSGTFGPSLLRKASLCSGNIVISELRSSSKAKLCCAKASFCAWYCVPQP